MQPERLQQAWRLQQPGRQPEQRLQQAWRLQPEQQRPEPGQQQPERQPEQQPAWLLLFCRKRTEQQRSEQQRGASSSFGNSLSIKNGNNEPKYFGVTGVHVDQLRILAFLLRPSQFFAAMPHFKCMLQAGLCRFGRTVRFFLRQGADSQANHCILLCTPLKKSG